MSQHTSGTGFSTNILAKDTALEVTGPVGIYVSKAASGRDVCYNLSSAGYVEKLLTASAP